MPQDAHSKCPNSRHGRPARANRATDTRARRPCHYRLKSRLQESNVEHIPAGGPAEFDISGSKPIRGMVVRAVSPHPDPLPQGEGTASIAQWKADRSGLFSTERMVHPLPKGEGWGEGKGPTAPRGALVLALAYG